MQRTLIVLSLFASLQLAAQNCSTFALEDSTSYAIWSDGAAHPSGGLAAVWLMEEGSGDIKVARLDGTGSMLWQRRIATTDQGIRLSYGVVRLECYPNGDILIGGSRATDQHWNCFAVRLDAQGNILWARIYGVLGANGWAGITSMATLSNGGALMGFTATTGCYLTRLDPNGIPVWTKNLAYGIDPLAIQDIIAEMDGDITLVGAHAQGGFLLPQSAFVTHLDALGSVEWVRIDSTDRYTSVTKDLDEGYLLASGGKVIKLDSVGAYQWSNAYSVPNAQGYSARIVGFASGEWMVTSPGSFGYTLHCANDGTPLSTWTGMEIQLIGVQGDSVMLASTNYEPFPFFRFPKVMVTTDPDDLSCEMTATTVTTVVGTAPTPTGDSLIVAVDSIKTWTMSLLGQFPATLDLGTVLSSTPARPGFALNYWGTCLNSGYNTSASLNATFTFDPLLTFNSASPAGYTLSGNVITWSGLPGLGMWDEQQFNAHLTVPPNVALLGTQLNASLNVVQNDPEASLLNNTATWDVEVTGSYDPNDKLVEPANMYDVVNDSLLNYTIRFQNTGNDTAFTVLVVDTLPATVSVSSFLPGASSHPYTYDLNAQGIVQFTFNNILLPDSNVNEAASHGLVAFSVRPDQGLALGTLISNSADIYFDFNPPVRTPPAVVSYGLITEVPLVLKREQLLVYPVPVRGSLTAVLPADFQGHRLTITALDGRLVATAPVQQVTDKLLITVDGLTQGAYVLEVQDRTGRSLMARFVKE